jgi:hypothetical protein
MLHELKKQLSKSIEHLYEHPLYARIQSTEDLHCFMQSHVFAVWDFMSLVKRLQQDLTCTSLPWIPPENPVLARFINEITLGEETDRGPAGLPVSHLELYLEAMKEIGASTLIFDHFLEKIKKNIPWNLALQSPDIPPAVAQFVQATLKIAQKGSTLEVAVYFLMGREDPIPEMFKRLLKQWSSHPNALHFCYYLERHISVDGEEHGPTAEKMLYLLKEKFATPLSHLVPIARSAIEHRIALWDSIFAQLNTPSKILCS